MKMAATSHGPKKHKKIRPNKNRLMGRGGGIGNGMGILKWMLQLHSVFHFCVVFPSFPFAFYLSS